MAPKKKKQKRSRQKPSITTLVSTALLALPALDAFNAGPSMNDKIARFKRNYAGIDASGNFNFQHILQTQQL